MIKRIICLALLMLLAFQTVAYAQERTSGDVVFKDALYGAAIGGILGFAVYLADDDNFGEKVGIGVAIGTLGGLAFGLAETRGIVEIRKGGLKFNAPRVAIQKRGNSVLYSTNIFKVDF